jgi:hypothetical protein
MSGTSVRLIQQALADAKLYKSTVDGIFGGGTEAAVKLFQKQQGLPPTGAVDPATWAALLPTQPAPVSPLANADLLARCVALTGAFETNFLPPECFSVIAGDFDGQGISFGAMQWNIGQQTLQPLLKAMFQTHPEICRNIFHEHFDTIVALGDAPLAEQLSFARSIQTRNKLNEPWAGMLRTLGQTPECQTIESQQAVGTFDRARASSATLGLLSQRGVALMFDVHNQNGGIGAIQRAEIQATFASLPASATEVDRMTIIANNVAAHSRPLFADDVRTRKLTIANGTGRVHGMSYDLSETFLLTLDAAKAAGV